MSQPVLIENLIIPLVYKVGDMWHNGTIRVANEHLASAVIRSFLTNLIEHYIPSENAPVFISATPRGQNHELEPPFFVLATQNPIELEGTYPLPEAQLDRFLFNVLLDYLDDEDELAVINRFTSRVDIPRVTACTNAEEILRFQWLVRQVPVAESVNRYAVELVRATRPSEANAPEVVKRYVNFGASVRATMFLNLAAKASALLQGRYHVTKDDVRKMALPVLRHRVLCNYFAESDNLSVDNVLIEMLEKMES